MSYYSTMFIQRCQFHTKRVSKLSRMQLSYKKGKIPSWTWWTLDNCEHWPSGPSCIWKTFWGNSKNLIDEHNFTNMSELQKFYKFDSLSQYELCWHSRLPNISPELKRWIGNILEISLLFDIHTALKLR